MAHLSMVELASSDAASSAAFMNDVFGFGSTSYGPEYEDVAVGTGLTLGFQGDASEAPAAPLPIIEVDDLEATQAAVTAASGLITREPFAFPGGRRFEFREPGGAVLAAWQRSDS